MTELDLYKHLYDEDGEQPEMRWHGDELLAFIHHGWLDNFCELVGSGVFDDGGIPAHINSSAYIVIDLVPICEYHGINPENILKKGD